MRSLSDTFLWKRASQLNNFFICWAYENENVTDLRISNPSMVTNLESENLRIEKESQRAHLFSAEADEERTLARCLRDNAVSESVHVSEKQGAVCGREVF